MCESMSAVHVYDRLPYEEVEGTVVGLSSLS